MSDSEIPLILFAKQPVAGLVKTRMQPDLTEQESARLAEVLLEESIILATRCWPGKVLLAVWPDLEHDFIRQQFTNYDLEAMIQAKGNLGVKMATAMSQVGYPCAVMGCDVPHCSAQTLLQAHRLIQEGKNVIGPTLDGGYYFLGLQSAQKALFNLQQWGDITVLEQTEAIANQHNIVLTKLDAMQDIDTYQDLKLASKQLETLKDFLVT